MRRCALILFGLALALMLPIRGTLAQSVGEGEQGLIAIINEARAKHHLDPLRYEPRLTQIARAIAESVYAGGDMKKLGDGIDTMMRQKGYPSLASGANYGTTQGPVSDLVNAWVDERGNRSFLFNADVTEIGVAYKSAKGSPVPNIAPNIWAVVIAKPARPAEAGWADRVIRYVNEFRAREGEKPIKRNAFLDRAAMGQARDMLARDFFAHINPDGKNPGDRATAAGYRWGMILENIAAGQPTPRDVVDAWIRSKDGHREAMLNPAVTEVGVGYVFAPFDPGRVNALHYWALELGRPKG